MTPRTRSRPPRATCVASGAPDDYHAALFAYNHAEWYVAQVLAKAAEYRGSPTAAGDTPELDSGALSDVLHNPRITLTPIQQTDLRSGAIDPRLIATLAWIGRHHSVVITALKSDHSRYTVDGAVSNHAAGRAMDIGAVDGETCRGTRTGRVRRPGARARGGHGSAALDGAHLLLGPRRTRRPARLRPCRPLRPHPLGFDG